MIVLRDYQSQFKADIREAWNSGYRNVLAVMPTGMGKTKSFASLTIDIVAGARWPVTVFVHRKELIQQISLTFAEEEIVHNIIAPRPVINGIVGSHRRLLQRQFYDYNALVTIGSVDTLNSRIGKHEGWAKKQRLWITDEATHLLKENKWGRAVSYLPNAIGLGVTATPERLDKKGLGRHADGVFDCMVEGPSTRWGIQNGFLCNYKIAIPSSDYQRYLRQATAGSDYSKEAMVEASNKSQIVGDVVKNYVKFAEGKQAIVFATDVGTGLKLEQRFNLQGIKAKFLSAESGDKERLDSMLDYRDGKINVLINVDLFDEGLDVPGIECVIQARPTKSLSKYLQMCGRGLRPAKGKPHLILIDHVGNVTEHGLPDEKREWTLDRIAKKRDKINFMRICGNTECNAPYDRTLSECPYCGTFPEIAARGSGAGKLSPKEVDGDLELLDPDTLRHLEASVKLPEPDVIRKRVEHKAGVKAGQKAYLAQVERINTQKDLSHAIAKFAGHLRFNLGYTDRRINKYFYLMFEKTITMALGEPKADMLLTIERLQRETR